MEKAIDEFRQDILPLIDPRPEENRDGAKLKSKEQAILQAGLRLVGHCLAILIYQLVLSQNIQLAANRVCLSTIYSCELRVQAGVRLPVRAIDNSRWWSTCKEARGERHRR